MESMASLDCRDAKKAQKIGHTSNTAILSHAKDLRRVRTGGSRRPDPDRKRSTESGAARKPLTGFKRDLADRPDDIGNSQRQRSISQPRQRYEQRGLSSLLLALATLLAFQDI